MKILLTGINAKYIHSNLALYSLRAYAGEYKEYIELAEYTINHQIDYILQGIYKSKPDVLCFSCYVWNIEYVKQIAAEYHKLCPKVPVWVGGPEVSYQVEEFLEKNPWCTGIIIGEGEATFKELSGCYINGAKSYSEFYGNISGLAYREGDRVVTTAPREVMNMNDIPFCYDNIEDFENRIIYYESSRGCPFSCSYCLSSIDKKLRFRNVETVKSELRFFLDKKVAQVKFVDRTFNCYHEHAYEIWKYIYENDNGITNFHFEVSADLLNDAELELIGKMRPGLIQLEIGVQSTNSDTITEIHRTMNLSKLNNTVARIQKAGNIHEHLDLIAGLPYENYKIFARSFDDVYALKPNQLQLGFLKVLKGSYMYEHAGEYGIVSHDKAPYEVMKTKWLSFDEVLKLKQVEEMVEVYYNSGQYDFSMKILEKYFDSAFVMYQSLGALYEKKGYFAASHNRLRRAEILLEFVEIIKPEAEARNLLEEALIFDLYTRENCKTRPGWAVDIGNFKDMTRKYCPKGKLSHIEPFHYDFPDKSIKTLERLPDRQNECVWYLFDYENRDPLDHQASVVKIEEKVLGCLANCNRFRE